jgi:hypothetical protein
LPDFPREGKTKGGETTWLASFFFDADRLSSYPFTQTTCLKTFPVILSEAAGLFLPFAVFANGPLRSRRILA